MVEENNSLFQSDGLKKNQARLCDPKYVINCSVVTYENNIQQQGGEVVYYNKKFVEHAQAITRRQGRGAPYKSSITFTILHPWGNNVSCEAAYSNKYMPTPIKLKLKMCEYTKVKWMVNFVKTYSNLSVACPVPAATYTFSNIELPPKGFPLPILSGKNQVNYTCYTNENDLLLVLGIIINVH
ncbi:hypothetical protein ACJJTC_017128 [Scirpophaga incertulas]